MKWLMKIIIGTIDWIYQRWWDPLYDKLFPKDRKMSKLEINFDFWLLIQRSKWIYTEENIRKYYEKHKEEVF